MLPPPRFTKLTQTWKTQRSMLTPLPPPCPRPPLPLLVAALQGVVETMKGKWKSDWKSLLTCLDLRCGREGGGYFISLLLLTLPTSECWRSVRRAGWGCELCTIHLKVLQHGWNAVTASEQTSSSCGSWNRPLVTTLRMTITPFKSVTHDAVWWMMNASGTGGEKL